MRELVFKHLTQLVQRTEPAEPLITVIYKPDSTLMGRQNPPSQSFLPLLINPSVHPRLTPHLCSPFLTSSPLPSPLSSLPFPFPLLFPLGRFRRPSYSRPPSLSALLSCRITLTHCFTILKEKGEGRGVSRAGEFPRKQRKNVFLPFRYDKPILPQVWPWASQ